MSEVFGTIPLEYLPIDLRPGFDFPVDAAPAAGIVISKEVIYAAAAALAALLSGLNDNSKEISSKLSEIIAKLDQVLMDLQKLRYDIREIVRDEISGLIKSELAAHVDQLDPLFAKDTNGVPLNEGDRILLERKVVDVPFTTLTLKHYRNDSGYAHWSGLATGVLLTVLAKKLHGTPYQDIKDSIATTMEWFAEAQDATHPFTFRNVANTFAVRAAEIEGRVPGSVGEFVISYEVRTRPGPGEPIEVYTWSILTIGGTLENGFIGSIRTSPNRGSARVWRNYEPSRGGGQERMQEIIGTMNAERKTYLDLKESAKGLEEATLAITKTVEGINDVLGALDGSV